MKRKREDIASKMLGIVTVGGGASILMAILKGAGVLPWPGIIVVAPYLIPTIVTIILFAIELRRK